MASFAIVFDVSAAGVWLATGLAFALGAAVGSFLNVVAYRLPRGMSLSRPGSRCPACGHPIRWYDNVPIFGWLALGGRCRDCRAAIPPRYPVVEALAAVATAVVVWSGFQPTGNGDAADALAVDFPLLIGQLLLVYTLLCSALLEFDDHPLPLKLPVVALVGGVGLSLFWTTAAAPGETAPGAILNRAAVLAAALLLGSLAWPMLVSRRTDAVRWGIVCVVELALVGAILGLTALAVMAAFSQALSLTTRVVGRFWASAARFGWAGSLALGTLIWIVAGREIAARLPAAVRDDSLAMLLAAGSIVAVLSILGRAVRLARARPSSIAKEHP